MSRRGGLAIFFAAAFFLFAFVYLRMAILYDADSYYHLAVARLYGQHGIFAANPWARFSILAEGADKDFLFHLILLPFATFGDAAIGGRIALALFNAAIATVVAMYAVRAIGPIGYAIPLWLWIAAPPFFARVARLRPELLALLVILLAIDAAARRRPIALALLAFAFALGYTAFHVFFALVVLWCWRDRRMIAAAGAGIVAGLLLRPHPIATLRLWYLQNVEFFRHTGVLDVGNEILPPTLRTLAISLPFIAALIAFVLIRTQDRGRDLAARNAIIAAAVFLLLFARFGRMATYAFPLALLAVLLSARLQRTRVVAIVLALSMIAALPFALDPHLLALFRDDVSTETDLEAFGRAVPPGAKVAATWGSGELYAFWAPQAHYLNVLEPLFMAAPFPEEYGAQRRIFAGVEPDIATVAKTTLDSDFLAFDRSDAPPLLLERLRNDPRVRFRNGGANVLVELRPDPRIVYTRADPSRCATIDRELAAGTYSFAPYGEASIDGRPFAPAAAILARSVAVDLAAGPHRIVTCPDKAAGQN
ncbi:MAG TPA: hypothetical protein VN605_03890, partial [Thermoanaerobaculia bacterium]|nr:hypothetical protein [Thermoanaerobaculia bacterium]